MLIVGGNCEPRAFMLGAPALASRGALRGGAGLVRVVCPHPLAASIVSLTQSVTCCTYHCDAQGLAQPSDAVAALDTALATSHSAVVVGCGLGQSDHARALVYRSLHIPTVPVVLDADALHALAHLRVQAREIQCPLIITPHPGEFAVLAAWLAIEFQANNITDEHRTQAAALAAQRLGCIVVLKGHRTVVTNGHDSWVCSHGHPCMATAGTGDVLAGLIGALAAASRQATTRATQSATRGGLDEDELATLRALAFAKLGKQSASAGMTPSSLQRTQQPATPALSLFDCARVAVLAHSRAGEAWASQHSAHAGLLASELADCLPLVLAGMTAE